MEFTNYILEAAGVSDVDIMDIEVTQAMAEMAVLEAMMDCYEKQMVLLEYNEEAANEIFTEAETFVPGMSNEGLMVYEWTFVEYDGYITESSENTFYIKDPLGAGNKKKAFKWEIVVDTNGPKKLWFGTCKDPELNNGSPVLLVSGSMRDLRNKIQDTLKKRKLEMPSAPELTPDQENELKRMTGKSSVDEAIKYLPVLASQQKNPPAVIPAAKEGNTSLMEKKPGENVVYTTATDVTSEPKQLPMNKPAAKPAAQNADQWDGSANVSTASKSFGNSFKKFMSKAGSVIQQLVLGLVDAVFSVNFDKLADKIAEKGSGFTMNDKQFQTINRLEDLMDLTQQYYGKFDSTLLSRVNWTRAEVNKYKNILSETSAALKQKYVDTGVFNDSTEQVNSPNKQTTPEDLIDLCHALGKNDFKKLLRKCQKEAAAYNTDFNENANIPPEIGKAMRTFVNDLIKVYNKTTKDFKGMLNWALEVGAAQSHREKNGGIDQSPVGFKKSPKAKELQEQRKAYRKAVRDSKKQEGWAEEGWSMNLSEDEDFF